MRKDAMRRPSSPHVNHRSRALSRSNIGRHAGWNVDVNCCPGCAREQVAMTRPILGDNVIDAVHDEGQDARIAVSSWGRPRFYAATNP